MGASATEPHRTRSTWSPASLFLIAVVSVAVALVLGAIWFFAFAGSSLPGA